MIRVCYGARVFHKYRKTSLRKQTHQIVRKKGIRIEGLRILGTTLASGALMRVAWDQEIVTVFFGGMGVKPFF